MGSDCGMWRGLTLESKYPIPNNPRRERASEIPARQPGRHGGDPSVNRAPGGHPRTSLKSKSAQKKREEKEKRDPPSPTLLPFQMGGAPKGRRGRDAAASVNSRWRGSGEVPGVGLEPTRPKGQGILSPLRLPVPPPRRVIELRELVADLRRGCEQTGTEPERSSSLWEARPRADSGRRRPSHKGGVGPEGPPTVPENDA